MLSSEMAKVFNGYLYVSQSDIADHTKVRIVDIVAEKRKILKQKLEEPETQDNFCNDHIVSKQDMEKDEGSKKIVCLERYHLTTQDCVDCLKSNAWMSMVFVD